MWFGDAGNDARVDPEAQQIILNEKVFGSKRRVKGDVARAVFYMALRYQNASRREAKTPLKMNDINEIVHNNFGDARPS